MKKTGDRGRERTDGETMRLPVKRLNVREKQRVAIAETDVNVLYEARAPYVHASLPRTANQDKA